MSIQNQGDGSRRMKFPSLSKNGPTRTEKPMTSQSRSSSWSWQAYCHRPKTLSFRGGGGGGEDFFRTVNSAFLHPSDDGEEEGYEEDDKGDINDQNSIEMVINGARTEGRLFFEPAGETSSVLAVELVDGTSGGELGEEGVAMCVHVESRDPYRDFRMSMEEMVEAHSLTGKWDSLEDLLHCYLRVNDPGNHAYIFRAFVDLLLSSGSRPEAAPADCSGCGEPGDTAGVNAPTTSTPCSPLSFYTSSSSCRSSSDFHSTTPCCISIAGEAEENNSNKSNGSGGLNSRQGRRHQSSPLKAEQNRPERDDQVSSSSTSSS
ncbi:hypothetical protein SAY86_007627 [Trapa natans]|uniref:Transcription repressor n=1 Tax=Trapa natans TaxID=22666 RepID=A0AAN7L8N3_TRANT|nr:hypothetical protein SAY86_007627 [Trapa natans]